MEPITWFDTAYRVLQLVGFVLAVRVILWVVEFRNDVKEVKNNHIPHLQSSQDLLVGIGQATLSELRELRSDIRSLSTTIRSGE